MSRIPEFKVDHSAFNMVGWNLYKGDLASVWFRETLQNAIDAGAKNVEFSYRIGGWDNREDVNLEFIGGTNYYPSEDCAAVELSCTDDGHGMTEDVLLDKFLMLGGTYKQDEMDAIGGFGVAKAIILSGQKWSVHTNDLFLSNEMMGKESIARVTNKNGTTIKMAARVPSLYRWQINSAKSILSLSRVPNVKIKVNVFDRYGECVSEEISHIRRGKVIDTLDWGGIPVTVSCNNSQGENHKGIHVCTRGLYQFTEYLSSNTCIFIDIPELPSPQSPNYPFTLSREGLLQEYKEQIVNIIETLIIEPSKVKDRPNEELIEVFLPEPKITENSLQYASSNTGGINTDSIPTTVPKRTWLPKNNNTNVILEEKFDEWEFPFMVIKSKKHQNKRPETIAKHMKILSQWRALAKSVFDIYKTTLTIDDDLIVGLILDDEILAEYRKYSPYSGLLINSLTLRITDNDNITMPRMLLRLVEEIVHSLGYYLHDSDTFSKVVNTYDDLLSKHYYQLMTAFKSV